MPIGVTVLDGMEALLHGRSDRLFRVGLALPMTGTLGQVGPSAYDAVILAAQEVQRARAASERPLELVLVDAGAPLGTVAGMVADLARARVVDGFVGLHTSDVLEGIELALRPHGLPYVFTPGHEDSTHVPGLFCPGESPAQLARGLGSVIRERGVREWAVLGSDYVWPRAMRAAARAVINAHGGRVVLDRLLPVGCVEAGMARFLDDLTASPAAGLVLSLPGRELTAALSAISERGLDRSLVRFSGSLEENGLYAIDGDTSGNLYSAMHSFESLCSPQRQELNERYRTVVGEESPALNSWAEHCYDGVHLLDRLERAGLLSTSAMGPESHPETPAGAVDLRPAYELHLAVAAGLTFEVLTQVR